MAMTVVFRVDAGIEIGSGHVMRSLALAEALRSEGARVLWIARSRPGDMRQRVASRGFEVRALPPAAQAVATGGGVRREHERWLGVPWEADAVQTLRALERSGAGGVRPDLLVVDHYGIDARWESRVRPHVARLCAVDDLGDRAHACDVLISPGAGRGAAHFRRLIAQGLLPEDCRILAGASYALIASGFAERRWDALLRRRERSGSAKRVLVCFGGVDRAGLTLTALRALDRAGFRGELDVVIGEDAPHKEGVARLLRARFPSSQLHISTASMPSLMAEADLAIGAAGVTSWERCALGLPAVVLCAAANQARVARALGAYGAALVVGEILDDALSRCIAALLDNPARLRAMAERAARLCDGLGTARAALALIPESAGDGKPVTLRPARIADTRLLYEWQTHPSTRRYARRPDPPRYEEHRRWVRRKVRDPSCLFHIIEYDKEPAGVIRVDARDQPNTFEVSIHVDPGMKRRGIARAALKAVRRLLPWAELHAWVLPENEASRRLFESAGYTFRDGRYVECPRGDGRRRGDGR